MEEKINLRLVLIGFLSIVMTAVLTVTVFQQAFRRQVQKDLQNQAETLAECYALMEGEADWTRFLQEELRLTLVTPQGDVLYESAQTAGPAENHLDRQEIQQALKSGTGEDVRRSRTMGYETYYYALRLSDGNILRLAKEADTMYSLFSSAVPVIIVILLAVLLLSVVLAVFLTKRLVRPIEEMAAHLDDPEPKAPYPELKPFALELHQQRRRQQELENVRREFTANVSHELKTPLTSILGLSEMIENGMAKPEDVPVFAGRIHQESQRLLSLISDILKLSQLDEEQEESLEMVDLLEIARDTAARLQFKAEQENICLTVDGVFCPVKGNAKQLSELCYNLCDNAIRYNQPGGKVEVSALMENGAPVLSVRDTGIGIPPEHQDRVFERFYRVDKSRSKETGGTGLGLAIVKHIAMIHGAAIQLRSEEGRGTEVKVIF